MENTSLVKIEREQLVKAYENYTKSYGKAQEAYYEAARLYKSTLTFGWFDKLFGKDKLSSEELLEDSYQDYRFNWDGRAGILKNKGLLSEHDFQLVREYGSKWRDEVKVIIQSGQDEIYLGHGALQWVVSWGKSE